LYAQATGQSKVAIYAESDTKFFFKVIDASMVFVKDDNGVVTKMMFTQGRTIEAKKNDIK